MSTATIDAAAAGTFRLGGDLKILGGAAKAIGSVSKVDSLMGATNEASPVKATFRCRL